ncbi:tautomerase family protein [Pseudomonas sp. LA5]|uniref:tautomerase family protein n=1 Tax=Pseudomonas sp. LA5 TaxID=3027850 RepID=UPI00236277B0|nr:tautomerase family protein [Pseudomonas sp. LA5]
MPLLRIDVLEGHNDDYLQNLLDGVHHAVVEAFDVPVRDRYQVLTEHKPGRFIMQDTGLDIPRTHRQTLISITSRLRDQAAKTRFYAKVCHELHARCGIEANDVMVSIVVNGDEDWSFGQGRAQFLTGEL